MAPDLTPVRIVLALAATLVYVAVGIVVGRRAVSRESVVANNAFQSWWFGLGLISTLTPFMALLDRVEAGTGRDFFALRLVVLQFVLVALVVAIGALVYYLLYVYTGSSWVFWPVAAYHLALLVWLMYVITDAHPIDYGPNCPSASWCYAKDIAGSPASRWLGLSVILPILGSALAYFGLFFRVQSRVQKFRVAMVAGALVFWFGSSLVAQFVRGTFETASGAVEPATLNQWIYWAQIVSPSIGVFASLMVLLAYRPPAAVRRALERPSGG